MLPANIKKYLNDRGINDDILQRNNISWNGKKIIIPIYSPEGKFLFNKYRKDPNAVDDSPKYTYDTGSTAALFNAYSIKFSSNPNVFITEGEFDTLCLRSVGHQSVSSTGGCGTFKEEWSNLIQQPGVYIVYDRDAAGYRGALRVQQIIPRAKIIILPEFQGKDVTDFISIYGPQKFTELAKEAESWLVPLPNKKIAKDKQIKNYNDIANKAMHHANKDFGQAVIDLALKYKAELKTYKRQTLEFHPEYSDKKNAKQVPISNYINFNARGFARCLWHNEKTASLKYYPKENRVHCFGGCMKSWDVIDVVQHLNAGCSLPQAVRIILNKE